MRIKLCLYMAAEKEKSVQLIYDLYSSRFGSRNSYSKTDVDATFMHIQGLWIEKSNQTAKSWADFRVKYQSNGTELGINGVT